MPRSLFAYILSRLVPRYSLWFAPLVKWRSTPLVTPRFPWYIEWFSFCPMVTSKTRWRSVNTNG